LLRIAGWIVVLLALCWSGRAAADVEVAGQRLDLRVQRGATCLDLELLTDELSVWLKGTTLPAGAIVEVIGSEHDPLTLTTRVHGPDGGVSERVFSPAPSFCPYLHQAVALTLSLALKAVESGPAAPVDAADPALGPDAAPQPGPPPSLPEEPSALHPSAPPVQLALSAGAALATGAFGHVSLGGSLGVGVVLRRATVGGDLLLLRSDRSALAPTDASYRIDLVGGRFGACALVWAARNRVGLEACVEGLVGRADVDARGGQARGGSHVMWGVQPGLAVRAPIASQRGYARLGIGLVSVYRPLRVAAHDQEGALVGGQSFARVAGIFTLSLGYGGRAPR
jgi:hypothetical protein